MLKFPILQTIWHGYPLPETLSDLLVMVMRLRVKPCTERTALVVIPWVQVPELVLTYLVIQKTVPLVVVQVVAALVAVVPVAEASVVVHTVSV